MLKERIVKNGLCETGGFYLENRQVKPRDDALPTPSELTVYARDIPHLKQKVLNFTKIIGCLS